MRSLFILFLVAIAHSAIADTPTIRLRSEFTGRDSCLDIINAGNRDQLSMANCGNFTGQMWEVALDANSGFVRLRTRFTGASMCLDVINDGDNSRIRMAQCANVTGQQWHIEQAERGSAVRLWNQFTGDAKCLDIANDGSGHVQLSACGEYSGQYWSLSNRWRG
jgi:hypothetical protein